MERSAREGDVWPAYFSLAKTFRGENMFGEQIRIYFLLFAAYVAKSTKSPSSPN